MTDGPGHELVLERHIAAPRHAVYRCWTEAALLKQWFAPAPWTIAAAEIDPRPGGGSKVTMRGPAGEEIVSSGMYLEVVADERITFTDAFTAGYLPGESAPFMVATVSLSDEDGGTRYVARARHWSAEARARHEAMGFHAGWGQCAAQLEALARTL